MKSVAVIAVAAGLAGTVSAHGHQHEHLHKRGTTTPAPEGTPCPQWTGGHKPPAYLTNLPLSVQAELPSWTGFPPPDWCSQTAWMQSYVSCATVYESCSAGSPTTGSTTPTGTPTGTSNWNGTATGSWTATGTGTWGTAADPTITSTSTGTWGTWSDSSSTPADPATTSTTSTWGTWTDSSTTPVDPATTSTTTTWGTWTDSSTTPVDPATTSTTTTWGTWTDSSTTPADPATTSTASTWGSWVDPASTTTTWGTWASSVDPAKTKTSSSTSTTWGSWVDPSSYSTPAAAVSTSTTSWGTWADPASSSVCGCTTVVVTVTGDPTWAPDSPTTTSVTSTTYTTVTVLPTKPGSSTTTWGSWDPSTSSSSSTTSWGTWADGSSGSPASSTTFSTAWSTPTSASKAVSSGSPSGGSGNAAIAPAGSLWAITYSPYTSSGGCKDAASVTTDITAIKALGFTTVRIYSTDCSGLENVGAAAKAVGLKLILGVFIEASGISGAQPQVSEIVSWGQWDIVEMIIIGNEALFNGYLSVSDLSGFIESSKWAFSAAGYTGPVTTTEPLNLWQEEGASLCSAIDVVAANIHAFFNAQTSADQAGAFLASELAILDTICPGKSTYVVESGWPHAGDANGAAVPGVAEQATALASIQSTCGSQVVFFTYEDDLWKAPGAFNVEQSWGCASVFGSGSSW